MRGPPAATQLGDDYRPPSRGLLSSAERAALLQYLWRLRRLRCADTKSTFIVLACLLNAIFTHYRNPQGR